MRLPSKDNCCSTASCISSSSIVDGGDLDGPGSLPTQRRVCWIFGFWMVCIDVFAGCFPFSDWVPLSFDFVMIQWDTCVMDRRTGNTWGTLINVFVLNLSLTLVCLRTTRF